MQRGEITGGDHPPTTVAATNPQFRMGVKGIGSCEIGLTYNDSEPLQALS